MAEFSGRNDEPEEPSAGGSTESDPLVTCEFQDGTIRVYENTVHIERSARSKFTDKAIPIEQIVDVVYSKRLVISYLQIHQSGVETDDENLLSTPVDENTLHFGHGKRACATRAAETIRSRLGSTA